MSARIKPYAMAVLPLFVLAGVQQAKSDDFSDSADRHVEDAFCRWVALSDKPDNLPIPSYCGDPYHGYRPSYMADISHFFNGWRQLDSVGASQARQEFVEEVGRQYKPGSPVATDTTPVEPPPPTTEGAEVSPAPNASRSSDSDTLAAVFSACTKVPSDPVTRQASCISSSISGLGSSPNPRLQLFSLTAQSIADDVRAKRVTPAHARVQLQKAYIEQLDALKAAESADDARTEEQAAIERQEADRQRQLNEQREAAAEIGRQAQAAEIARANAAAIAQANAVQQCVLETSRRRQQFIGSMDPWLAGGYMAGGGGNSSGDQRACIANPNYYLSIPMPQPRAPQPAPSTTDCFQIGTMIHCDSH